MADPSFDIVSKVDRQEVDNALNQTAKEAATRYDFKGTGAEIAWSGESIVLKAGSEERCAALLDVFKEKLVKRQISLKTLDAGEPQQSGKEYRLTASVSEGISQDNAKKVSKVVREPRAEGRPGADPGRPAAGVGEEEGRPAGRDRAAQGRGVRLRPAVHQLPVAGHLLEPGDALGHRRVGAEQLADAAAPERVGDHQASWSARARGPRRAAGPRCPARACAARWPAPAGRR